MLALRGAPHDQLDRNGPLVATGTGGEPPKEHTMPDKKPQHPAAKPAAKTLKQKRAAKRDKAQADRNAAT